MNAAMNLLGVTEQ